MWIRHDSLTAYSGDRLSWRDILVNPSVGYPDPGEIPVIEDGVHVANQPNPDYSPGPDFSGLLAEFRVPDSNSFYTSVAQKVGESGFLAQDHWGNFKDAVTRQALNEIPASIQYLAQLLDQAGYPLNSADVLAWNSLCDRYHLPEACKLTEPETP